MSLESLDRALAQVGQRLRRRHGGDRHADVLGMIGEFTGADLAFLYVIPRGDTKQLRSHHRWARAGVEGAWEIVPGAPIMDFAHYREQLASHGLVRVSSVGELPQSAKSELIQAKRRGIRSVLMLPTPVSRDATGTLALYALRHEVAWSAEHVAFARHAGALLGQAVALELAEAREHSARQELQALERGVQDAQRLESLGVLAGGIAHDFNNLLAGIVGNVEVALMKAGDHPVRVNLERARTAAHRAGELTNQMLAYSGRGRFQIRPLDVNAVIRETEQLLRTSIARSAELRLELAEALPAVDADPPQVGQVIMNLIINAAESLPEGVGHVTLSTDTVRYSEARSSLGQTLEPGTYVRIRVEDSGCGMDRETLERIFDPFYTTKISGRGLGLAAVQGIVRGHSGGLWVESRVGEGTTFTVVLPKSERSPSGVWSVQSLVGTTLPKFSGRVLLADDETHAQQAMRALLEELGLEVESTSDGVEALARFELEPDGYKLVVLDLTMPGLGGVPACRRMRALRPELPVLLMSGFDQSEMGELANEKATGFVQKPVALRALASAIVALTGEAADAPAPDE